MSQTLGGIHHVTAIAGDPQQNVNFYTGVLSLRIVKLTVNFDDPGAYHLYFGDKDGNPGSIITFFAWPGAPRGRQAAGQVTAIAFSVPEGALDYWERRLEEQGVVLKGRAQRFEHDTLLFADPDGLPLELVAHPGAETRPAWEQGEAPGDVAIRGVHSVTMAIAGYRRSAALLTGELGFHELGAEDDRHRYEVGPGGGGALVDVVDSSRDARGRIAVGQVHHIAWRTPTDEQEIAWRQQLLQAGLNVTPVINRLYFHSIYFHEPGGVLFEIATDPPGFALDEPADALGARLVLPPWYESRRAEIEEALSPIRLPVAGKAS